VKTPSKTLLALALATCLGSAIAGPKQGTPSEPPVGFTSMCERDANLPECGAKNPNVLILEEAISLSQLSHVNREVNEQIQYVSDKEHYGVIEYWEVPTDGKGVCHAYALAKLHKLLALGWDIKDLHLAVGKANGEWHVVLLASFEGHDWVLDSATKKVVRADMSDIVWNRTQIVGGSREWVAYTGEPMDPK
jgi:predicted transglutaminase-like cysteine proteinase